MKLTRACIVFVSALAAAPIIAADAPPVPVVVTTARSENVGASLAATGTVVSRNDARISTEVAGLLAWIAEPGVGGQARRDHRAHRPCASRAHAA